jgi:hypothetical protein
VSIEAGSRFVTIPDDRRRRTIVFVGPSGEVAVRTERILYLSDERPGTVLKKRVSGRRNSDSIRAIRVRRHVLEDRGVIPKPKTARQTRDCF